MEAQFSPDSVYDFLKLLVETGGVHYVDNTHCIFRTDDRTPVGVKVGGGKDSNKQIALYKEGTKPPANSVYLNPFDELLGHHPEREWFMNMISIIPGCLVHYTMKQMTELINSKTKDTKKFKEAQIVSKFVDRVDDKLINELNKIRPLDAGMIFYDKSKHIAQLLCDFWQKDFEDKMKSKIRKSSLQVIRDMAAEIYGTETPEEIMHTATLLACPRFDATVHVLVSTLTRIHKITEEIVKIDLHTDELNEHLKHLEAYHKALQWLATSSASPVKSVSDTDAKIAGAPSIPWNVTSPAAASGLPANIGSPAATTGTSILGNVGVAGVTPNPTFGGGVTKNPTFGMGGMSNVLGNAGVFDPGIPGLGRVAPVVPRVETPDFSKLTMDAYASMGYGTGFGGGFLG